MRLPPIVVLTLALASAAQAQTYTMKTFAGGALPENVPGASASLGNVYGIAIDNLNNVFLSLGDYHIVVRVDANTGVVTRVAGTGTAGYNGDNIPAASAEFNGLADLAIDSSGNLYVADFYNQAIRLISQGTVTTVAGNGTYGTGGDNLAATSVPLAGPTGIALDSAGNLYIAEGYNNKIRKVSGGIIGGFAGSTRPLHSGDAITLYLTGLGRTAQTFAEGAAPKTASNAVETVQIQVQGQPAQVTYTGVQPQYPGFDQVNVKLPNYTLTAGQSAVTFQITAPATGQTLTYTIAAR